MTKKIRSKFRLYKRYKVNIWGDLGVKRKFFKLVKIMRGNRRKINEAKLLRKLILRIDLRQPSKRSKKIHFPQKYFFQRGMIKKLYGNYKEKEFRRFIRSYKKDKYLISNLEHRIDLIIWRAGFVPRLEIAKEWLDKGFILVNGKEISEKSLREGDVLSIVKYMYGEVVNNVLLKLYMRSFTMLTKYCYEVNYRTMEICLIRKITPRRLRYLQSIKGGLLIKKFVHE